MTTSLTQGGYMVVKSSNKKCFIITPIGSNDSEIRRHADGVIDSAIEPVLKEIDFDLFVSHRMSNPGSITRQILSHIIEDDLVIANLTSLNPNVMYELAVRHAVRKPVILICEEGTKLPFDITDERTIFYVNDMKGVVELKEIFSVMVSDALKDEKTDNPIYRATKELKLLQEIDMDSSENTLEKYLISRLNNIEESILKINKPAPNIRKNKNEYEITLKMMIESSADEIRKKLSKSIPVDNHFSYHTYINGETIRDKEVILAQNEVLTLKFRCETNLDVKAIDNYLNSEEIQELVEILEINKCV
jgi:hypothetical protein